MDNIKPCVLVRRFQQQWGFKANCFIKLFSSRELLDAYINEKKIPQNECVVIGPGDEANVELKIDATIDGIRGDILNMLRDLKKNLNSVNL